MGREGHLAGREGGRSKGAQAQGRVGLETTGLTRRPEAYLIGTTDLSSVGLILPHFSQPFLNYGLPGD